MAFDFPNSPTVGQVVTTPGGQQYQWDAVKWGPPSAVAAAQMGNVGRNLLHNPYFNVQQRGVGPWSATGAYTADRWFLGLGSGDTATVTVQAANDAARAGVGDEACVNFLGIVFTGASGASNLVFFSQRIEGVRRFAGKTVTLSFYADATAAGVKLGAGFDQN